MIRRRTAAVLGLRRLHQLREPGRPQLQHRDRGRRGAAGVDDILYDYVRRPDGPSRRWSSRGCAATPSPAIIGFLREPARRSKPYGTYLGASVFGIAATRPDEVAQDIPAIAREVDYVAPMVYPSHWGTDEYGVAEPERAAVPDRQAVARGLPRAVRGTGARLVPWLQDFSLGVTTGRSKCARRSTQRDADGIDEFLLWDPRVTYTTRRSVRRRRSRRWDSGRGRRTQHNSSPCGRRSRRMRPSQTACSRTSWAQYR